MRPLILIPLCTVLLFSCRNENAVHETENGKADSVDVSIEPQHGKIDKAPYAVEFDNEAQTFNLKKESTDLEHTSPEDMVEVFNEKYKGIKIELAAVKNNTVELRIPDARKLTQEMGSAGAQAYLAELTFSFTELKGIKAVKLDFPEGDHAMPGVYTREDFDDFIK